MDSKKHYSFLGKLWAENRLLKLGFLVMLCSQVVLCGFAVKAMNKQRTILVPLTLQSSVEFAEGRAEVEYVREMARFFGALVFNYTPNTARKQFEEVLGYYVPGAVPTAKKDFADLAFQIEEGDVTSTFLIQEIKANLSQNKVYLRGMQRRYAGDSLVETEKSTYLISYEINGGAFQLLSIAPEAAADVFNENTKALRGQMADDDEKEE